MRSLQHTGTKIPGDPSLRKHLHISQPSAPQTPGIWVLWLWKVQDSRGEIGSPIFQRVSSPCSLHLSLEQASRCQINRKVPHKSDSQRLMPLQGTAHQLPAGRSTQTSPAGGNLVCLHWALVPDTPGCLLLLSSSPEPPTRLPVRRSSPGLPPSCWWFIGFAQL